jgi:hypothetical protein
MKISLLLKLHKFTQFKLALITTTGSLNPPINLVNSPKALIVRKFAHECTETFYNAILNTSL